jgi:hypothetical protein
MKLVLQIIGALAALILLYWAISALLGYTIGIVIVAAVAIGIVALLKTLLFGHNTQSRPDLSNLRKADKSAEKMLVQLEKRAKDENAQKS